MTAVADPPKVKITLSGIDRPDGADVYAEYNGAEHRIAELWWDGSVWLFLPLNMEGQRMPAETLDVDPEQTEHLRALANENAAGKERRSEAVNEALDKALEARQKIVRDDTREIAEIGARGKARIHWRSYELWLQGCTGYCHGGDICHDADTCPIHYL